MQFLRILRTITIGIVTLAFLFDTACKGDSNQISKTARNDTTEIIRLLLDSSFYRHNLADMDRLYENNPFGDSIIFKVDSTIIEHIPTEYKIKLLTQDQICSLATQLGNDTLPFANFLTLKYFKKADTTYEIAIQNTCVVPLFDKTGKQTFGFGMTKQNPGMKCMFGFLCGGGINMSFTKQADTLKPKIDGRWYD